MSRRDRNENAAEYFRLAPGYSAEAIPALLERASRWAAEAPLTAGVLRSIASKLESAHKFALPHNGWLFDEVAESMVTGWSLPFPVCAFEFSSDSGEVINPDGTRELVARTIVLAVQGDERTILFPVLFTTKSGWRSGLFFPVLCRDVGVVHPDEIDPGILVGPGLGPGMPWGGSSAALPKYAIKGIRYLILGEMAKERIGALSDREFAAAATEATSKEMGVVMQTCSALSCTNVTTEVIRPNREAHAIKPASTLFDYHVLVLRPGAPHDPSMPGDGTHASPRTHLRRGHIRRHPTAGRIWVNSCVVNPGAIGSVNKDYAVMPGRQRP